MDRNQSGMTATRGRLASLIFLFCISLLACKIPDDKVLPRNQSLPLFNPHVADFICEIEASKVPPIDAQAEDWFLEARALEDPEIFVEDRDYKKNRRSDASSGGAIALEGDAQSGQPVCGRARSVKR